MVYIEIERVERERKSFANYAWDNLLYKKKKKRKRKEKEKGRGWKDKNLAEVKVGFTLKRRLYRDLIPAERYTRIKRPGSHRGEHLRAQGDRQS